MMSFRIERVQTRNDLHTFIHLPAKIHKNHSNWVPPIYMDERTFFNPKKNRLFAHSDTCMFLAWRGKQVIGRIMGIINHKYNDEHELKEARFVFLESYEEFEVAQKLIDTIEEWAREKQMSKLVGPLGFSDKDPQGLLIEGYEHVPVIATNYNFKYMVEFVERAGFKKKVDLVVYKLDVPKEMPEFYTRINERALRNHPELNVVKFRNKLQLRPYIKPVFQLVNETFKEIYAFTPLDEQEMNELAGRYIPVLDPRFVKVIEKGKKEVVAFVLSMPDFSKGVQKCKGRVLPIGFFQILRSQKKTKQLNLLLGAVRKDYRNTGLDAVLGTTLFEESRKAGIEFFDSHLELETNKKVRAENEKMGGKVYKRYRIFQKDL
jgi:GNAT superfamily N-acetyltransferase